MVIIAGEAHKIGKSTRGRDTLNRFVEDVVAWLQDNYAPPAQALALQLSFLKISESMGNHDSNIVDAGSVD